ncbi:MAG: hypothetical protein KAI67_05780 [Candidatus Pacebacteria bacterium]|nr:hypothetical protein [Candidatus Paceibacterota bacterium]
MESLTKRQNKYIVQQLAVFFYKYFRKGDLTAKAKNNLSKKFENRLMIRTNKISALVGGYFLYHKS